MPFFFYGILGVKIVPSPICTYTSFVLPWTRVHICLYRLWDIDDIFPNYGLIIDIHTCLKLGTRIGVDAYAITNTLTMDDGFLHWRLL